jgi:CDK-activating kinase assembly factor MAT1
MRDATNLATTIDDSTTSGAKPFFAGLKQKPKPAKAEGPYDVFAGGDFVPDRYKIQKQVPKPPYEKDVARDPHYTTGGYDVRDYYVQAMYEAFAGLGVFVDDEKEMGGRLGLDSGEVASMAAGLAAAES